MTSEEWLKRFERILKNDYNKMEFLNTYKITPKNLNKGKVITVVWCDDGRFYELHERKVNQRTVYVTELLLESEVDELFNHDNYIIRML